MVAQSVYWCDEMLAVASQLLSSDTCESLFDHKTKFAYCLNVICGENAQIMPSVAVRRFWHLGERVESIQTLLVNSTRSTSRYL